MPSWGKVRTSAAYCLSGMVIPSRRPLLETTRNSGSYMKRPARVAVTTRATKANVAGQFGGWRAPTVPHPAQSSPTSKGNCFKLQTNRLPSGVKHRLARNCQSDPFRHRRLHGGSALLSIPGSTSESAEATARIACRCPSPCSDDVHCHLQPTRGRRPGAPGRPGIDVGPRAGPALA